nr:hypothetical protein Itr_chr12CG31720 [Ipomoea trifida]
MEVYGLKACSCAHLKISTYSKAQWNLVCFQPICFPSYIILSSLANASNSPEFLQIKHFLPNEVFEGYLTCFVHDIRSRRHLLRKNCLTSLAQLCD